MAQELKNVSAFTAEAPCGYPGTHSTEGESRERKKRICAEIHHPGGSLVPKVAPGDPTLSIAPQQGNQSWEQKSEPGRIRGTEAAAGTQAGSGRRTALPLVALLLPARQA